MTTNDELKTLITSIQNMLKEVEKPVEEQLHRLQNEILPKDKFIVDCKKWITIHRSELLKDGKLMAAIDIWELLCGKKWHKKLLRKSSSVDYWMTLTTKELSVCKNILQLWIIDYSISRWQINQAKSLVHEWEYYDGDREVYMSSRDVSLIISGIFIGIAETLEMLKNKDEMFDDQEFKDLLEFAISFLNKKAKQRIHRTKRTITEDGILEHDYSTETHEVELKGEIKRLIDLEVHESKLHNVENEEKGDD
jgi:phage host-nuclease inhibitor protein Gam